MIDPLQFLVTLDDGCVGNVSSTLDRRPRLCCSPRESPSRRQARPPEPTSPRFDSDSSVAISEASSTLGGPICILAQRESL